MLERCRLRPKITGLQVAGPDGQGLVTAGGERLEGSYVGQFGHDLVRLHIHEHPARGQHAVHAGLPNAASNPLAQDPLGEKLQTGAHRVETSPPQVALEPGAYFGQRLAHQTPEAQGVLRIEAEITIVDARGGFCVARVRVGCHAHQLVFMLQGCEPEQVCRHRVELSETVGLRYGLLALQRPVAPDPHRSGQAVPTAIESEHEIRFLVTPQAVVGRRRMALVVFAEPHLVRGEPHRGDG